MAISGTIQGTTKNSSGTDVSSRYGTWISWKRNSTSIANNTSNITVTVYVQRVDGYTGESAYNLDDKPTVTLKVGGAVKSATTYVIDTRNQKLCTVATWTGNVTHSANGTLSLALSCSWTLSGVSALASGSISGTAVLDTIPRYATLSHSLGARSEITIKIDWSSDSTVDYVWYSKDNGATWTGAYSTSSKSGTYYISYLEPNTTYQVKTRIRRKDSQLTTDSSTLTVTTYNYPYCNSAPNFKIGDAVTIGFYNPLGREISWQMYGADGSLIAGNSTTGTSYSGINGDGSKGNLYKSIPNAQSGRYTVSVAYGPNVETATGGTYSVRGTEVPTINSFTYKDNNSTTVAITGNNQHIVQNYSTLLAQVGNATASNGAGGIAKYVVECNNKKLENASSGNFTIGAVNSASNVDLKLTVTDTRGLSSSKTIKVTMLAHNNPSAVVSLERLNNYEDETYLTVDGSVASVNSKNTMAIKYRYKQSGGSYGSYVTINDRQKYTLSLDKNNAYVFNVVVTDAFGSTFTNEYVLNKGMFPLFIDTAKNSVGINCFPVNEMSLEVNGLDISTIYEFKRTLKLNANTWTNVGINYTDLASGTYVMEVFLNNNSNSINGQFGERISGILSWYALPTNSNNTDVIPVSKCGHARNNHNIQLRVARTVNTAEGYLRLQMMDDVAWNGEGEIVFRFKRLI